jgi:hypothetical protein
MDRARILQQLLTISYDEDFPLSAAGDYAGVDPETEEDVLRLWLDTLERNSWLVPDGVFKMRPEDGAAALAAGAGYFLTGYMLARREQIEAAEEMGLDVFAGGY